MTIIFAIINANSSWRLRKKLVKQVTAPPHLTSFSKLFTVRQILSVQCLMTCHRLVMFGMLTMEVEWTIFILFWIMDYMHILTKWVLSAVCLVELLVIPQRFSLIKWLAGYVTDWLADWLTDGLTHWLNDWLTHWLTGHLADSLANWLTDGLADWVTLWLTYWLADWLANSLAGWLTDWQTGWLSN